MNPLYKKYNNILNDETNSALYWFEIPAEYQYLSTDMGNIYGIKACEDASKNYEIYYPSYSDSKWIKVNDKNNIIEKLVNTKKIKKPLSLKYFVIKNENLYGINSNNDIYYADYNNNSWYKIDDNRKMTDSDCNFYTDKTWDKIPGKLKQVSIENNVVCGVNNMNNIYCADTNIKTNPNWFQIPGSFRHVSLYNKGIFAVDMNWKVYHCNDYRNPVWKKEPIKLKYDIDILLPQ